ncbi:Serine/threonine-protein kinase par-1 [Quaeritorhiza haematococci]|nr:Serine/threonine-protein kinase par-1 [Quaeritorhiza haematococci]
MLSRKKILGDYHIGKTIGQGAFSKVKLGYHKETGQKVAIKVIDKKLIAEKTRKAKQAQEERERAKRRAEELKRLEAAAHPTTGTRNDAKDGEKVPAGTRPGNVGGDSQHSKSGESPSPAKVVACPQRGSHQPQAGATSSEPGSKFGTQPPGAKDSHTPAFISELQTEVQLLMRLNHPNVIRVYQVLETEDECYVVMEYAAGGELIDYIAAKKHLTEKEARKYFRQMISALDHCHQAHVVHRDLKLENLLLNNERNLLISDFGLGRTFKPDDDELMKTFCGTPNYAAVELVSGIPYIGIHSDIWAMGVVLYVMMAGRPPFHGENIAALYTKIKAVDYKCPEHFSPALRKLLSKILVKDPKQRIDMDGLRNDPWVNFEETEPPLRVPPIIVGDDPSQIAQVINGIHTDKNFIVYSFRQHNQDKQGFEIGSQDMTKKLSLKRNASKRISIAAPLSVDIPAQSTEESDKISPLPAQSSSPLSPPKQKAMRRLSLGDRSASPRALVMNQGTPAVSATPTNSHQSVSVDKGPPRRRRNTISDASGIEALRTKLASTNNGTPTPTLAPQNAPANAPGNAPAGRQRRASISVTPTAVRDTAVLRRMSMVGSARLDVHSPPTKSQNIPIPGSLRNSTLIPSDSSSNDPLQLFKSQNKPSTDVLSDATSLTSGGSAEDPDPMVLEGLNDCAEVEPSEKEIEDWHLMHKPAKEIRTVRFSFNASTTSSQPPNIIFREIHEALTLIKTEHQSMRPGNELAIAREVQDYYMLTCRYVDGADSERNVEFEIEVCKVWLLNKLYGIRIKRLSGNPFMFKELYQKIVDMLQLK